MQFRSFSNLKGNSIIKEVIEPFPSDQIRDVVEPSNSFMLSHIFAMDGASKCLLTMDKHMP